MGKMKPITLKYHLSGQLPSLLPFLYLSYFLPPSKLWGVEWRSQTWKAESAHALLSIPIFSCKLYSAGVALPAQPQIKYSLEEERLGHQLSSSEAEICLHNQRVKNLGHSPAQLMTKDTTGPYRILIYLLIPISGWK